MLKELFPQQIQKAKAESIWVYHLDLFCCGQEVNAASGPRYDWERIGCKIIANHRQSDLLIVSGPVTPEISTEIRRIYNEMKSPRFVMAVGSCACTGGMFSIEDVSNVRSLEQVIPVDLFVPGCPPRPESIIYGILQLKEKILAK